MNELITSGKTVEEAVEKACQQLGLSRLEVNVEIIEMPEKKLFRSLPAKVRVTAATDTAVPQFLKGDATAQKPKELLKEENPESLKAEKPAAASPKPAAAKPAPNSEKVSINRDVVQKILQEGEEQKLKISFDENPLAENAKQYILQILSTINVPDVEISAYSQGEFTLFEIESASLGDFISIDGELIQSLSYLIDRAVNKNIDKRSKDYLRVRLDISGYRDKRETELLALAKKIAEEVLKTKRSKTLAPMNSYERLIIHTAIGEITGLRSESRGEDATRRVVIKSVSADATDGPDWREQTSRRPAAAAASPKKPQARAGRPAYNSNNKKEKFSKTYSDKPTAAGAPIVPKRREPITDGENVPLYGKIEF